MGKTVNDPIETTGGGTGTVPNGPICTTSDLAGLAAREAGYAAPVVDRVAEIRGRLEAAVMGPALDKFGSAIVDGFGCCAVCGKWTNPGHPDAQSHKDGCAAHREEVRYAQALHAIYRTATGDLRHLLNELADVRTAPKRAMSEAEIRGRITPKRAAEAAEWDPETDGHVCAECMKSIRLLEECEWDNGEDVCDECAPRLLGESRADVGHLLNELDKVTADRDAYMAANAEAEAEINRGRPGYHWISDEALASLTEIQQQADALKIERDALAADLARARRTLAVEQGREGPEGWHFRYGWWVRTGERTAGVHLIPTDCVWRWSINGAFGDAPTALEAIEAAERALKGP